MPDGSSYNLPANRLLASLPDHELAALLPLLESVDLRKGATLSQPGQRQDQLLFIDSGMISLVTLLGPNEQAEAGTIGREGMLGISALTRTLGRTRAIVQVSGNARRLAASHLEDLRHLTVFNQLLRGYIALRLHQAEISVACNALHTVQQRTARWLVTTYERAGREFSLKQEFLAEMLGVRRASVSGVASAMQADGLIRYSRGLVSVLDPHRLEAVACSCHRRLREAQVTMLEAQRV